MFISSAISRKVAEWQGRKEAILRGEAPPSELVRTEAEEEDIYKVQEEHEVGTSSMVLHVLHELKCNML